ncbi:MAG: hypothetical protein JJLCMIEE_02257 [Acidimicrobiales bacterium]|nr:MAG: DNA-processing protein DprA [Actinomycetota bacterium]MBV6509189.1 hypothetical protein [Acidimicrobiales bacterium]RIK08466.1 MAG: DNA-protecting protein DprA [Acidobacteriota bacterium]
MKADDPSLPLPAEAYLNALASLPDMGPARLRALLTQLGARPAWSLLTAPAPGAVRGVLGKTGSEVLHRTPERVLETWVSDARRIDVAERWDRLLRAGVGVVALGSAAYPAALADDHQAPAVLFHSGDPDAVAGGPRAAVIGTRRCTRYGAEVAFELGRDLAEEGVGVVSGLALGIDGAAHSGALAVSGAPPVAVVGSGLDVVYPRRNRELWRAVARRGAVFSEAPLGSPPQAWRFPQRNRLIAALADVVVVVECHSRGGSMHTVRQAADRSVPVMAVPGPVRSSASMGTNSLIADGCAPCTGAGDVMTALGLVVAAPPSRQDRRVTPSEPASRVLEQVGWQPVTIDGLADRCELPLPELMAALDELCRLGWLTEVGGWLERVALGDHRGQPGSGAP